MLGENNLVPAEDPEEGGNVVDGALGDFAVGVVVELMCVLFVVEMLGLSLLMKVEQSRLVV